MNKKIRLNSELTLYPCPVVLVTCQARIGIPNIITVSWAGIACSKPEMVSIAVKPTRYSYELIAESREFVVNIPTTKHIREADICGTRSGREVDKFQLCRFTADASSALLTPSIKECPVSLECEMDHVIEIGGHHLFVARIVAKSIDPDYCLREGQQATELLDPIVYLRPNYFSLNRVPLGQFGFTRHGEKNVD